MPVFSTEVGLKSAGYVLVAGKDFGAATESEPSITLAVVSTSSSTGQFLASDNTQILAYLFQGEFVGMRQEVKVTDNKTYLLSRRKNALM